MSLAKYQSNTNTASGSLKPKKMLSPEFSQIAPMSQQSELPNSIIWLSYS